MAALFPPQNTFIFLPGAPQGRLESGSPVYSDFTRLYADLSAATTGRKRIIFDDSLSSPCTIPAGTYNMDDVEWAGAGSTTLGNGFRVRVEFALGVTITNLNYIQGLYLHLPATIGSPIAYNSGGTEFLRVIDCTVNVASTTPMMVVSGTTTLLIQATEESTLGGNNEEWLGLVNVDTVTFNLKERSRVLDDSITSGVNGVIGSITLDATGIFNPTQPQFQGTGGIPTSTLDADAVNVGFTPSVPSNWATVPTGVDEALDGIAGDTGFPQTNVVYVSKVGNDSNSGLTPGRAKLTIGSAVTAASGLSPGTNNRITIEVLDAGTYAHTSSTTLPDYVSLHAPFATITSTTLGIAMGIESRLNVHRIICGGAAVSHSPAGNCWVRADYVEAQGGFSAIQAIASTGQMFLAIGDIVVNTGSCIFLSSGTLTGDVGCLDMTGAGNGVNATGGTSSLHIGRISGTGIGFRCQAGTHDLTATSVLTTTAYNISFGATLNVVVTRRTGSTAVSGTLNELKAI